MTYDIHNKGHYHLEIDGHALQMSDASLATIHDFLHYRIYDLKEDVKIFEYGSGVSTIWLGKTFPETKIVSVEGGKVWLGLVTKWVSDMSLSNVTVVYREAGANWRDPNAPLDREYLTELDRHDPPYDLIINDGCARGMVERAVSDNLDRYLKPGGLYLRHDYEHFMKGDWVAPDEAEENKKEYWPVTVCGNGRWGIFAEFGGIWRRP